MNRIEFKNFVQHFGKDTDILGFRLVHDQLSSKECWKEFGFNNSVNLSVQKKELIKMIESGQKILLHQEKSPERLFDIEDLNRKGFAVFILPNLGHRKADISKILTHVWDFDCGKEIYNVETEEEAELLKAALKRRDDIDSTSICITKMKRKKQPFSVKVYLTVEEIVRCKQRFLNDNRVDLAHCLINESPNGFRGFYFYNQAQKYVEEEYQAIQKGIIDTFRTDAAFLQAAQAVRVTGFYHNKREPFLVKTVQQPSEYVTKEQMKSKFLKLKTGNSKSAQYKKKLKKNAASKSKTMAFQKQMIFIDAIDYIKQQDITDVYEEFSYKQNFSCVLHNDEKPSARLGIFNENHLYTCFSCKKSLSLIDLYIEIEKNGERARFREAVTELAAKFGIEVIESEFYIKETTKYQRNMKWLVQMFDDKEMEIKYPVLYKKFFSRVVRYKKNNQNLKEFEINGVKYKRLVGGEKVLDKKGNPIKYEFSTKRELVLKLLTFYGNARLRDINVNDNSIFWISFSHMSRLLNKENMEDEETINREKSKIFYLVKELELLGFFQQIDIEKVPNSIRKKAEKLSIIKHSNKKVYKNEIIKFYSMNDFFEVETLINQKAEELQESGYRNTVHQGKNAMLIHQGNDIGNQLYQNDKKMDPYFEKIKKKLLKQIKKELSQKGYFFKQDITKIKFKLMMNSVRTYVTRKEKEKVLSVFLYGKNGFIETENLEERKLTKSIAAKLNMSTEIYNNHKLHYIYIKRG